MNEHLSEDQICRAIAGQATIDEQRHVHACLKCRTEIEHGWSTFGAFRRAVITRSEQAISRSVPSYEPRAAAVEHRAWTFALAGIAGVVAVAVSQIGVGTRSGRPGLVVSQAVTFEAGFFPLPYVTVPVTEGHIVRLEVPSSSVEAFGVDPAELVSPRPDAVLADVLVGEDGLARAVRFVRQLRDDSVQKEKMR